MSLRTLVLFIFQSIVLTLPAQLTYQLDSTILSIDVVVDSDRVDIPWEIIWGPDQRLWMTDGPLITRWDPVTDVVDTIGVRPYGNGLGMAIHPFFPQVPQIFAVFDTAEYYAAGQLCEVIRFEYDVILDTLINDTVILNYPHAGEHAGGRLTFDDTEHLLLTTADYWLTEDTLGHKKGKVLRMNIDGSVPVDNPTADHTWTRGHRNPQGMTKLPNGNILISEHGQAGNNEINLIEPDKNYGWAVWDGNDCTFIYPDSCTSTTYITEPPLYTFDEPPAGTELYTHSLIPEFQNKLITSILWFTGINVFKFNTSFDQITGMERYDGGAFDDMVRIRDIAILPDGSFYLITNDRMDARIRHIKKTINTVIEDPVDLTIKIWPNPVSEEFYISLDQVIDKIELLDMQGRKTNLSIEQGQMIERINVSDIMPGLYIIRVYSKTGSHVERIVISPGD